MRQGDWNNEEMDKKHFFNNLLKKNRGYVEKKVENLNNTPKKINKFAKKIRFLCPAQEKMP